MKLWIRTAVLDILVLALFLALIHGLMIIGEIQNVRHVVQNNVFKMGSSLQDSLLRRDLVGIKGWLYLISDARVSFIEYKPPLSQGWAAFQIGYVPLPNILLVRVRVPIVFSGADLGHVVYGLSLLEISKTVIVRNFFVYLTIAVVFIFLIIMIQLAPLRSISAVESYLVTLSDSASKRSASLFNSELGGMDEAKLPFGSEPLKNLISTIQRLFKIESEYSNAVLRDKLARQVAHDIRSPLSYLKHVVGDSGNFDVVQAKRALERIENVTRELLSPKTTGLKVGMRDSGPVVRPDTDGLEIVEVSKLISHIIEEKNVDPQKIRVRLPAGLFYARADRADLERVISNLLQNAIEAMSESPTRLLTVGVDNPPGEIRIEIRDTGCGLPREILEKIKNGYRISTKPGGSGLGLIGSMEMVTRMGGYIKVFSDGSRGTTIAVHLRAVGSPLGLES